MLTVTDVRFRGKITRLHVDYRTYHEFEQLISQFETQVETDFLPSPAGQVFHLEADSRWDLEII